MYGRWTLAWALSLIIATPSFAFAQGAGEDAPAEPNAPAVKAEPAEDEDAEEESEEASNEESEATEASDDTADNEAPPEDATPADAEDATADEVEAPPADDEDDDDEADRANEVKAEEVPVESVPAAAKVDVAASGDAVSSPAANATDVSERAAGAGDAGLTNDPADEKENKAGAAATLGAAMAVDPSKPWIVNATLEQTLGQSIFVKDPTRGRTAYGYALIVGGSYDLTKLFEGTLRATARISADQQLTTTANDAGVGPRQFFLRDTIVGLSGLGLYTEKLTGTRLNGRFSLTLPTSLQSRAAERYLGVSVGGSAIKVFSEVGPGSAIIVWSETFQKNVASAQPVSDFAFCDSVSASDSGACYSALSNPSYSFFHGLTGIYSLGGFNVSVGLTLIQSVGYDLDQSTAQDPQTPAGNPSSSPFADPNASRLTNTTWGTVAVSYAVNENFSIAGGWSTIQSPYVQQGSSSTSLRFPWWDFQTPSNNGTTFFLDANFIY